MKKFLNVLVEVGITGVQVCVAIINKGFTSRVKIIFNQFESSLEVRSSESIRLKE